MGGHCTRRGAGEEGQEVNEVTGFTNDTPAALNRIVQPMFEWKIAGVDAIMRCKRFGSGLEKSFEFNGKRRKPAVEANCQ